MLDTSWCKQAEPNKKVFTFFHAPLSRDDKGAPAFTYNSKDGTLSIKKCADISHLLCYLCKVETGMNCVLCQRPICGDHSVPFEHRGPVRNGRVISKICRSCDFANYVEVKNELAPPLGGRK